MAWFLTIKTGQTLVFLLLMVTVALASGIWWTEHGESYETTRKIGQPIVL